MNVSHSGRVFPGVLFFLGSAQLITVFMIGEAMAPGYSVFQNAISDLGVINATRTLFNSSAIITGICIAFGGYLFHRTHRRLWITILFILAGIGAVGVGVFTLEYGFHGIFAFMAFLFFNFAAIASSALIRGPLKTLSVILGIIGLIALGLMAAGDIGDITAAYGAIGHGGTERMIVYPPLLWLMAFGGYLMAPSTVDAKK